MLRALKSAGTGLAFVVVFLVWGYLHQLFSFADCAGGRPDMSIGAIIASGFGATVCVGTSSRP